MRRREFITLIGAAASAWPFSVRSQSLASPKVGLMMGRSRDTSRHLEEAFRQGLGESGFTDGRNVGIEARYGGGQLEQLPKLAEELVRLGVAVIAAGSPSAQAAKAATSTIPIVFIGGGDPIAAGLVANLNRPGGNVTGITMLAVDLETKRFGLLRELVPTAKTVAVLLDAAAPDADLRLQNFQLAARNFALPIRTERVSAAGEFESAFASFERERADALVVGASTFFNTHRDLLVALTLRHRIPAIFELREFVEAGGLLSYSPSLVDAFRQAGDYSGRILKGEKPADLPVLLPTKFELAINAKAAKALGIAVPQTILLSADEVIE